LRRSPEETILGVLGHEMGHYVLNHVAELLIDISLVVLVGYAFVHFSFGAGHAPFSEMGDRVDRRSRRAALAGALFGIFLTAVTPVTNSIVRSGESEADAFGIAASREPDGFAFAAVQLSEYRKMRPGRLEEIVFYDHPSGYDRIHRAMSWKAEHLDEMAARESDAARP
jgi:STE24 endopeptidase